MTSRSDEKNQSEKFKETAREHECDESEERFERMFKKIVPPKEPKKQKGDKESDQ